MTWDEPKLVWDMGGGGGRGRVGQISTRSSANVRDRRVVFMTEEETL